MGLFGRSYYFCRHINGVHEVRDIERLPECDAIIRELAELVASIVGYTGRIVWDTTKPNGTPRKLLDVSKATALGWTYRTELADGIRLAYADFLANPIRAER